jgi:BolA family transcriptional regulator, general stress-responsive regulator
MANARDLEAARELGRARVARIEQVLRAALQPEQLEIEDESHRHRGHAGAADGRGHFRVCIVSQRFAGQPRVARHRLLYAALQSELQTDIHALAIEALTPEEFAAQRRD